MRINYRKRGERRVEAVRRRMAALVGKKNLGTDDPLMAEIQMAQLDAMLAIAHAMLDLEGKIEIKVQTPDRDDLLRSLVRGHYELGKKVGNMESALKAIANGERDKAEGQPQPTSTPPWWKFWEQP